MCVPRSLLGTSMGRHWSAIPPPPPQFFFLLGITAAQREIENNAYAKFWGGK